MVKVLAVGAAFLVCSLVPNEARASPARNVTPTLLSRGTYPEFRVKSKAATPGGGEFEIEAEAKPRVDIFVRTHRYAAASDDANGLNSHTGWHTHPGPVFITVTAGELTIFEWDDQDCSNPIIVRAGEGYVDTGHGHIAINARSDIPAVDVTVITAPVGVSFRGELTFGVEEARDRPECKAWMDTKHSEPAQ